MELFSPLLNAAIRCAATAHRNQVRKGAEIPYIAHPFEVMLILMRVGYQDELLLAAALLHDVVEDTATSLEDLANTFPVEVVDYVDQMSEKKRDSQGLPIPWIERKTEHLARLSQANSNVRALALADKLHNLQSIYIDLTTNPMIWNRFNASRDQFLTQYRTAFNSLSGRKDDPRAVALLADAGTRLLDRFDQDSGPLA